MTDPTLTIEYVNNLAKGAAARADFEARSRASHVSRPKIESRQASWQVVDGVRALRINRERFVAVPASGRDNAARFEIIDLDDRSGVVCVLKRAEVQSWLYLAGA